MKKIFIRVLPLLFMLFLLFNGIGWALDTNFKAYFFSNTDHGAHIPDTDFDLNTFFKGVTIDTVRIAPDMKLKELLLKGASTILL